jgi:hypothetical protein
MRVAYTRGQGGRSRIGACVPHALSLRPLRGAQGVEVLNRMLIAPAPELPDWAAAVAKFSDSLWNKEHLWWLFTAGPEGAPFIWRLRGFARPDGVVQLFSTQQLSALTRQTGVLAAMKRVHSLYLHGGLACELEELLGLNRVAGVATRKDARGLGLRLMQALGCDAEAGGDAWHRQKPHQPLSGEAGMASMPAWVRGALESGDWSPRSRRMGPPQVRV